MVFIRKTKDYLLHLGAQEETFNTAHVLRNSMTEAEKLLWSELKNKKLQGLKFRRQHPIHWYIADFYCHEKRLVIELDGGIHMKIQVKEHDENRSAEFDRLGIHVIRFTNGQVLQSKEKVLEEIIRYAITLDNPDSPSPSGEGVGG
jgi:very-short-patch-repair endonuclease